jgi:hypothetical protein
LPVLFVQAAWVVLIKPMSWERHGLKPWIEAAKKRLHRNVLAVALANKLARIRLGGAGQGPQLRNDQDQWCGPSIRLFVPVKTRRSTEHKLAASVLHAEV